MTADNHSSEHEQERKLELAASHEPLDPSQVDRETIELREAWDAFSGALRQVDRELEQPIDTNSLWDFVNQEEDPFAAPTRPQRTIRVRSRRKSSSAWIVLAATAATLAIAILSAWQLINSSSESVDPKVAVEEESELPNNVQPKEVIAPEVPPETVVPNEQVVQEEVPQQPLQNDLPPATESLQTDTPEELYAWDDDLDDSLASAATTAHEIRYGWYSSSEAYRYVSTRFESINDSLADDSL